MGLTQFCISFRYLLICDVLFEESSDAVHSKFRGSIAYARERSFLGRNHPGTSMGFQAGAESPRKGVVGL